MKNMFFTIMLCLTATALYSSQNNKSWAEQQDCRKKRIVKQRQARRDKAEARAAAAALQATEPRVAAAALQATEPRVAAAALAATTAAALAAREDAAALAAREDAADAAKVAKNGSSIDYPTEIVNSDSATWGHPRADGESSFVGAAPAARAPAAAPAPAADKIQPIGWWAWLRGPR